MITQQDILQLKQRNIEPEMIQKQLERFRNGFPSIRLSRPAIPGDGLICFNKEERKLYQDYFDSWSGNKKILKFVPASGAATRMFKHLFEFLDAIEKEDSGFNSVSFFIQNIRKFAFFHSLHQVLHRDGYSLETLVEQKNYETIVKYLLSEKGLNYASLPKALLAFHQYPEGFRVAAEEHLVEAAYYAVDNRRTAALHFTVSPEHLEKFDERMNMVRKQYENQFHISYKIDYSVQKSSTDTIAVDEQNQPFRNPDGSLLFRPAGHGALLENLNDTCAEIVFIKNIDNIVPDRLKKETIEYKKLIGGFLLEILELVQDFLRKAKKGNLSNEELEKISDFAVSRLNICLPQGFSSLEHAEKNKILFDKLNRPIRVCGMVKNAGEPGGGPFWVTEENGEETLQIVESSQINLNDPDQKKIFNSSTHFNPVDLVCGIKDFEGIPFQLKDFVDESTGFISLKSSGGKTLKAMELPGLWNGSMAKWITLFVEVPLITFNPVKTINDLLRNEHQ